VTIPVRASSQIKKFAMTRAFDKLPEHMNFRVISIALLLALATGGLTSCAFISRHVFSEPAADWQARTGQLLYRNRKTTLVGEVLVRFSKNGQLEMAFSKGPGVNLLTLKQDASYAEIRGGLARNGWSGPIAEAPPRLQGWLELRDKLLEGKGQKEIRHTSGRETFVFHF
jgi:hypothetical protein